VLLLIDSLLTEPPSEVTIFRDITLYANTFKGMRVVIEADEEARDIYFAWLKSRGAFDFVEDIVEYESERGKSIRYMYSDLKSNLKVRSIGYHNFNKILTFLT
jgi:hypothetical protein